MVTLLDVISYQSPGSSESIVQSSTNVMPAGSFPRQTGVAPGGGGADTVIAELALWPSELAVMVAVPVPTAVTRPLALTVAWEVLELAHAICRPVRMLLLASRSVAES